MSSEMFIPVVLFVYARPDHLQRVMQCLRDNHIPKLIVYSDAPKTPERAAQVNQVRAMIHAIDWCEVEIHERSTNLGLGQSILTGMTDVFKTHEAAIIFEDDLICVPGTYDYLAAALTHYKDDPKVMSVSGWTHAKVLPSDLNGLPYFDGRAECWTWGTWARSWANMDKPALTLMRMAADKGIDINAYGADLALMAEAEQKQNIWAVRWIYAHILQGGLCLRPPHSMVDHIGYDNATNAPDADEWAIGALQPAPAIPAEWPPAIENPACKGKWQAKFPVVSPSRATTIGTRMTLKSQIKAIGKQTIPPVLWDVLKRGKTYGIKHAIGLMLPPFLTQIIKGRTISKVVENVSNAAGVRTEKLPWEYVPQGWVIEKTDTAIKGWNDQSILNTYTSRWAEFVPLVKSKLPFGISSEAVMNDHKNLAGHNIIMTFAYALLLAARGKTKLSMLDWGGGIGHYYLYSQALLPDVQIDYTCKDLSLLAEQGQKNFPEAHFTDNEDETLARHYDLVLASGAMHYTEDWKGLFKRLAQSATGYFYVTRVPTVHNVPSYVMVQRPYVYGFNTEYLGWCINRTEMLETAKACGLELVREFIIENPPHIYGAPEQCDYWGYLFRPVQQGDV